MSERREGRLKHGILRAVLLLFSTTSFGSGVPDEWRLLPQVNSFSFSESSVGLATAEGQHFVFDRATGKIDEVTRNLFVQKFAGAIGIDAREVTDGFRRALHS